MLQFAENVGWILLLGVTLSVSLNFSKAFLALVLDKGAAGEPVYLADFLILAGTRIYRFVTLSVVASVSAVAALIAVGVMTPASWLAAIGYASLTYVIAGLLTPKFMKEISPSVTPSVAPATEEKASSAPD